MGKNLLKCLLAVSAIGLLLSGCSKKTSTKDTSSSGETKKEENKNQGKEKVTLSLWTGEEDKDYIAVVTENFIKENADKADITIDWKPVIEGQCRGALLGDVLNAADVYTTTDGDIQSIVAGGAASHKCELKQAILVKLLYGTRYSGFFGTVFFLTNNVNTFYL